MAASRRTAYVAFFKTLMSEASCSDQTNLKAFSLTFWRRRVETRSLFQFSSSYHPVLALMLFITQQECFTPSICFYLCVQEPHLKHSASRVHLRDESAVNTREGGTCFIGLSLSGNLFLVGLSILSHKAHKKKNKIKIIDNPINRYAFMLIFKHVLQSKKCLKLHLLLVF